MRILYILLENMNNMVNISVFSYTKNNNVVNVSQAFQLTIY